jgi:hypothetical protein
MVIENAPGSTRKWFTIACLLEGTIGIVALALGWLLDLPVLATLKWEIKTALVGLLGAAPMLCLFLCLLFSGWFRDFRRQVEPLIHRMFQGWSAGQLAVISILAGLGEELFFRGFIQGGLGRHLGDGAALIIASLLFGLVHWINRIYLIAATFMGLYLGLLWLWSGNLLAPVVAHAAYDFIALMWILRRTPGKVE